MINELVQDVSFIGTSAPVVAQVFRPTFKASHVLLINDSNVVFRCGLTTALTTGSCILLTTGQQLFWQGLVNGCEAISLISTSSSTGGLALRLGAWA